VSRGARRWSWRRLPAETPDDETAVTRPLPGDPDVSRPRPGETDVTRRLPGDGGLGPPPRP